MSSPPTTSSLRDLLSKEQHHPNPNPNPNSTSTSAAAVLSVISILSAHAGRLLSTPSLRAHLRTLCLAPTTGTTSSGGGGGGDPHAAVSNLRAGIDGVDRLASAPDREPCRIRSLRSCIRLLSVVADINDGERRRNHGHHRQPRRGRRISSSSSSATTGGVANAHLTACAHLYLSMAYKILRKDRASARHLLQVFQDAPYFARKDLLPDLWDHFFLPHLLHLKVWYTKEVESISGSHVESREQRMRFLDRVYGEQMDVGTSQFALYYREWIKVDATEAPPIPSISLPLISVSRSISQVVFDSSSERKHADDAKILKSENATKEGKCDLRNLINRDFGVSQRQSPPDQEHPFSKAASLPRKSYSIKMLSCSTSKIDPISHARISRSKLDNNHPATNLDQAISSISNSGRLDERETAIRLVANAWLGSGSNSILENILSTSSFIEGLLDVSSTSKDDEVLELAVSILAELVTGSEVNRQVVLNTSPQLEVLLRLLRHDTLFLKAVVLLYLLKPKAKQMLSLDWMPLLLRILDNGDRGQTLFSIQCCPKSAALYLLDQLLVGFDVDRNVENARLLVSLGGLNRLISMLEMGDAREKEVCASLLGTCVRADDSCRSYLANNINKASIIQLLLGNQLKSTGSAISLLSELVCLKRTTQMIKFLTGFKNDGCLNTMHVLMVYLQQAPLEQRPLAAAILLQFDLLGDPLQSSFYREEGIDAIIMALERSLHNKKIQEQCCKALFLLGGHLSPIGEADGEAWLLKRAGLDYGQEDVFNDKNGVANEFERTEEEVTANESWLRKLAFVLLTSGNKRFLVALTNCIANGIPRLARSCLITIAWMSWSLSSLYDANNILHSLACSIIAPKLFESLNYDKALEERVLASLSLLNFAKHPVCLSKLLPVRKETLGLLEDLAKTTWTAKELLNLFNR